MVEVSADGEGVDGGDCGDERIVEGKEGGQRAKVWFRRDGRCDVSRGPSYGASAPTKTDYEDQAFSFSLSLRFFLRALTSSSAFAAEELTTTLEVHRLFKTLLYGAAPPS